MVPDCSESEPNRFEEQWTDTDVSRAHGSSYSDFDDSDKSYVSYESDNESLGKTYSDSETESGESFENDYESPEEHCPTEHLSNSEAEVASHENELLPLSMNSALHSDVVDGLEEESDAAEQHTSRQRPDERRKNEVQSANSSAYQSKNSVSQSDHVLQNERRRVKWAHPEMLNWSFHEGFVDNASRKRRQLKRWNSSDLEASSEKRRGGRRGRESLRESNSRRQDFSVRDPPGHHIESPSIKKKIFPLKLIPTSNDPTSTCFQAKLPVVVELDLDQGGDMPSEHDKLERTSIPTRSHSSDMATLRSNDHIQGIPPRRTKSSEDCVPVRRSSSSDGAAATINKTSPVRIPIPLKAGNNSRSIQTSNSSRGSSEGTSRSGSTHRAPATARRILECNKIGERKGTNPEWQSFEKINNRVLNEKQNPNQGIGNATSLPKMPVATRSPGRLSASLHYVGPRTGHVVTESTKFQSQSLHFQRGSSTNNAPVQEEIAEKNKRETNTPNDTDGDESVRETEVSSDSPSFALQVSQSSFSSFHSEENSAVKLHRNRPATSSIMSSATLTITVSQARGLISLERNMFGKMKPAEAFVALYLGGKVCGKTGVARRSNNPTWKDNEIVCEIGGDMASELSKNREKLELRIYDRTIKKENFMGAIMLILPQDDAASWYAVHARSEQEADLYCAGAAGSLEVKVKMTAKIYPVLTPDHVFVLKKHSKIALDLSWTVGSFLETSCVATDPGDGLILWEESVYFANRTNPNRSIVFPERLEIPGHPMIDTVVLDLDNVPKKVGALCLVLTAREKSLSELESFEVRCKDAITGQGIGRFVPCLKALDTSAVLLRLSRAKSNKTWELKGVAKGFKAFREFGSMLPEIQEIAKGAVARTSKLAERTALMRAGDSIRIQDYVANLSEKLIVGLFWKVANGENALPLALILDKDSHLLDVIHRQNSQSQDLSVIYVQDKFEVSLNQADDDIHFICFSLGPYLGEQADHILTAALNILNATDGTELVRSTIQDFDRFPTTTMTIGCFYRNFDRWDFALLGIPSSDLTIDECIRTLQNYLMENPLDPPAPLLLNA